MDIYCSNVWCEWLKNLFKFKLLDNLIIYTILFDLFEYQLEGTPAQMVMLQILRGYEGIVKPGIVSI